ncbi:MAG: EAL domain-containing protein [Kineosporiaceae bacterium]|nr:EAL domain-containing protein [Kineosporiaceae bacterium]
MEFLLRPGMRLMRRVGVAGKFGLIAVLLLVPMCTSMIASYREATGQISIADRERVGLRYTRPLVELVIELSQTRNLANQGEKPGDGWLRLVHELDDLTVESGETLSVSTAWPQLRAQTKAVYDDALTHSQRAVLADQVAKQTRRLLQQVADAAHLMVDPQLDSNYLITMLVDELPRVVTAAADAQAVRSTHRQGDDPVALRLAARDLSNAGRRLGLDLATALSASSWAGLHDAMGTEARTFSAAVTQYSAALEAADGAGTWPTARSSLDTVNLTTSATSLSSALVVATDHLLTVRQDQLRADRSHPLLLTLVAMAVVFYLLTALFRATTQDVRAVLEDINTVTTGGVDQRKALTGSDEFAQMSRAVVYARDRLTALVGALKYQATHDELTALANRALFTDKIQEALAGGSGQPSTIAVLMVDLDSFKDINDSFGHDLGDRVLRTIGARLHRCTPRRSVIARLGGDEFAILVTDARVTGSPSELLAKLDAALAEPVDVDGRRLRIQAGIGVALAQTAPPGTAPEMGAVEVMRNADVALSYAKARGSGRAAVFESTMHDATRERTELFADLVGAIDRNEMDVLYQPLVDLETGTLYGVEALLRWEHPTRGLISPSVFVPLAEATGLIGRIGGWVLERSCSQLASWQRDFPDGFPLTVEVNLATEQLADPGLVANVLATAQSTGIDSTALVLEITESSLVRDIDTALARLGQLSALGVKIALDDFGTGYSSLSYLRRLPATILKIDQSFVQDETDQGRALLRSIVALGAGQGLQIICEGIERSDQAEQLRAFGCHLGQGHLWAPALPAAQITEIMRRGGRMTPTAGQARVPSPRAAQDPSLPH